MREEPLGPKKKCSPRRMSISYPPVLSGVMFDGRISFDGIATVKNFGSWILFPYGSPVKRKSGPKFSVVNHSWRVTCEIVDFWLAWPETPKAAFSTAEFRSKI